MGLSRKEKMFADFYKRKAEQEAAKKQKQLERPKLQISDGEPFFKMNIPDDVEQNPHFFCSEECLVPFMNSTDTQRGNMFSSHVQQMVHLKNPEIPRVYTGFENQIGKYSVAYKKAQKDFTIVKKIWKNPMNYSLVVKYSDGVYDVIDYHAANNITEEYGYRINDSKFILAL